MSTIFLDVASDLSGCHPGRQIIFIIRTGRGKPVDQSGKLLYSVCQETPLFLSFRQSLSRNLLEISNGFPLTACGNDKFGQTLYSRFGSQIIDVGQSYYAPERKMKLEILPLTEENLKDAPEWGSHPFSCKYCLY